MKVTPLNNGVAVSDIDLHDDAACRELGRLVADECVVLVDQAVPEERLHAIHMLWGQPCLPILNRYVGERRLGGRHWRELFLALGYIVNPLEKNDERLGMCRVSFERNAKNKPTGLFPNGELDWHSDQQAYHDNQRVIGLMSLWGSENSQTGFLCTAPAYEALDHADRSMVDELVCVWKWDGGRMCSDLDSDHKQIIRYNMIPHDGMETRLVDATVTGRKGLRFPSHCFSHFKGMTKAESAKYKAHLWSKLDTPQHVYMHDWRDGQIVFMDQNITLHARPTDVTQANRRTMTRMISYLDRLYPGHGPADHVFYAGAKLGHEEFAAIVDAQRLEEVGATA